MNCAISQVVPSITKEHGIVTHIQLGRVHLSFFMIFDYSEDEAPANKGHPGKTTSFIHQRTQPRIGSTMKRNVNEAN